jgi:hypothetical protein
VPPSSSRAARRSVATRRSTTQPHTPRPAWHQGRRAVPRAHPRDPDGKAALRRARPVLPRAARATRSRSALGTHARVRAGLPGRVPDEPPERLYDGQTIPSIGSRGHRRSSRNTPGRHRPDTRSQGPLARAVRRAPAASYRRNADRTSLRSITSRLSSAMSSCIRPMRNS